jgi:hypothetical protein
MQTSQKYAGCFATRSANARIRRALSGVQAIECFAEPVVVAYFEGQNIKSATIQKKIGWLTAAVNLAIKEGRLQFNPFSSIVPKRDDKQTRLPPTKSI